MEDQAEAIARIVREDDELGTEIEAKAKATAHALIQGYFGPDHRVLDMREFHSALIQALREARRMGHHDCRGQVVGFG